MSILVTGSTGTIGTQVLSHLQGRGVEVRALTRSPDTAKLPSGVTPVRGDLADVDTVRAALDGVSTLFLLVPNVADELTQAMLALTAAREAGVRGIVYLSVHRSEPFADVPHFAAKHTVERMIEALDLIVGRKESKNMFYRLADGRVTEFIDLMFRMFCKPARR